MDMVGHQHISMQLHPFLAAGFGQMMEIELVIVISEEAGCAVIATLDQMNRRVIELYAGASRHRVAWKMDGQI